MTRWPPAIWLAIVCGALVLAVGVAGNWNPAGLIAGLVFVLAGVGLALYLAYGRGRPHARGVSWLVIAAAVYCLAVAGAGAFSGGKYVVAAFGAGLIPLAAAALIVATTRSKTLDRDEGRRETTAAESD